VTNLACNESLVLVSISYTGTKENITARRKSEVSRAFIPTVHKAPISVVLDAYSEALLLLQSSKIDYYPQHGLQTLQYVSRKRSEILQYYTVSYPGRIQPGSSLFLELKIKPNTQYSTNIMHSFHLFRCCI
jgi:hypothetical protein